MGVYAGYWRKRTAFLGFKTVLSRKQTLEIGEGSRLNSI